MLKTGEMFKMLKMLVVFWVLTPFFVCVGGRGQDPENFLTLLNV